MLAYWMNIESNVGIWADVDLMNVSRILADVDELRSELAFELSLSTS